MTPTKLLIGQIIVVFSIVIAGIWFATEWAAWKLAWQPELGLPLFFVGHWPVYRPWSIFPWWYHFDAYAPHIFDRAGAIAGASGFVGCGAAIAGSLWRARQSHNVTTYGSARWATSRDVERAGLHRDAGVFLGRLGHHYLRHDGPSMSLPSRRRAPARASAWSCRPCSAGPARRSSTTLRVRTGH